MSKPVDPSFLALLLSKLKLLKPQSILQIEESLQEIGPFGEVRLIKKDGELKFIQRLESSSFGDEHPTSHYDARFIAQSRE